MGMRKRSDFELEGEPKNIKENSLVKQLKTDEKLKEDKDRRIAMLSMAEEFLKNFKDNLYKTSIEMNDVFPYYSIDEWKEFLNYPVVRKYIKSFQDEKLNSVADQGLSAGDKSAIGIKKVAQDFTGASNNSNIILIRVPEKLDWEEEE